MNTSNQNYHLPGEAFRDVAEYDRGIRQIVPFYDQMLDTIAQVLPTEASEILELGSGTGGLSTKIIHRCPKSNLLCVDYSERMTGFMKLKMKLSENIHRADWIFSDFESLPDSRHIKFIPENFDACVSSLAIHHLSHSEKERLFGFVYELLKPGGHFWIADTILPENEAMSTFHTKAREQWLADQNLTRDMLAEKMVHDKLFQRPDNHNPDTISNQLKMLGNAGFKTTDVLFKYFGMAVFGGLKT